MEETEAPKEPIETDEESATSHIFIIKVTTNKEDRALELISDKVHKKNLNIHSLARPHGLRGYIFLEATDRDSAEEAAYNLPYVKGIIGKTVSYEEIKNMIEPVMEEINIEKGDVVEIIGEPFKKEKAKVIRVDKGKGEAVVTLLAAVVPIPVTVKLDNVKVIRREKEEGEEDEESDNEQEKESKKSEEKISEDTPLGDAPTMGEDFDEPSGGLVPDDY
jgi:transcriptional antiterminator NusG